MQEPHETRLESWKEIAAYLKRDVSTVQRWEKREGMPVHRHQHGRLGSVYAFPAELDAWRLGRAAAEEGSSQGPAAQPLSAPARRVVWLLPAAFVVALVASVSVSSWYLWKTTYRNPLASAQFRPITDFDGDEFAAAISRDGKFVAFLSDRDGPLDVWVTQVGSGQFHNLTHGAIRELVNPSVRTLGFSPDGTLVTFWVRDSNAPHTIGIWAVPTLGGEARPYLDRAAEFDWSHRGAGLVYHTAGPGDPTFVRSGVDGGDRQIFIAPAGLHAHFPIWSPDDAFIYWVQGSVPDAMDVWRMRTGGGTAERLTFHASRVSYPAFLNSRMLLYLATEHDGSGPWLYALDLERRITHRLTVGPDRYSSISVSGDGRRIALTVSNPKGTIWRVPITSHPADLSAASRIALPTVHGLSPRLGHGYLLYVSTAGDAIWTVAGGSSAELWHAPGVRIVGAPAIAPDGARIAFTAEQGGRSHLYVLNADGSNARVLTTLRDPRGAPAWTPDGRSIAVGDALGDTVNLVRVSPDDGSRVALASGYAIDPAWAPDGRVLLYSGADVGTRFPVKAIDRDGNPAPLPSMEVTRGGRRLRFMPDGHSVVFLRGDIQHKNFWLRDLDTGAERQLTDFAGDFSIRDFDLSRDGSEIVFDRVEENSDVVLIEIPPG